MNTQFQEAYQELISTYQVDPSEEREKDCQTPRNMFIVQRFLAKAETTLGEPFQAYVNPKSLSYSININLCEPVTIDIENICSELYSSVYGNLFPYANRIVNEINLNLEKLAEAQQPIPSFRHQGKINYLQRAELVLDKDAEGDMRSGVKIICYAKKSMMLEDTTFTENCINGWVSSRISTKLHTLVSRVEHKNEVSVEKRGPIPLEDRLWRYNYYARVILGVIPKRRPSDADQSPTSTAGNLWFGDEEKEKPEFPYEATFKREDEGVRFTYTTPKYRDGKWIGRTLNRETGLFEECEITGSYETSWDISQEDAELIKNTPLPPPPSQRACGYEVKMDAKTKDRWISKCPDWMQPWALMMIKPKDESWTK